MSRLTRSRKFVEWAVDSVDSTSEGTMAGEGGGKAISLSLAICSVSSEA
jgi:hypothetical protein